MSELKKKLKQMPPGSLVPIDWVISELEEEGEVRWVGILAAHEISRMTTEALRASAPKWQRMMAKGEDPPIRVRKKGDADRSHWLFDEADCWAMRPRDVVKLEAPQASDADSMAEHWADRIGA